MVDLLVALLLAGVAVLGWRCGFLVSLIATGAFCIAGLPSAAVFGALGLPPAVGFVMGGLVALVPLALRLERIVSTIAGSLAAAPGWRRADQVAGAAVALVFATAVTWFVAALVAVVPGESPALAAMRGSHVFGSLVEAVPPQGQLGVLVLRSGLVPSVNGPLVLAEEPDPASARAPAVLAARDSVLQVRSTACDQLVTGTGWVAAPGLVVTNAHVVAGSRQSFLAGGPAYAGTRAVVTAFDPYDDIAVLAVEGLEGPLPAPLEITDRVRHGEPAAVIGFPLGGRQLVVPARIDRVADYDVEPLGGGPRRVIQVLAARAAVQPGNSGGPILAEDGTVLGLVVSKGLGQRVPAAYGVPARNLLASIAEGARRSQVSTGDCLDEEDLRSDGEPVR